MSAPSALALGLVGCHVCTRVDEIGRTRCAHCGAGLHARKPNSLVRTTALLAAATVLYLPANVLPIMTYRELGVGEPKTILAGCRELIEAGLWSLAAIVFTASIVVPALKLFGLGALVWSVQRGSAFRPVERTRFFHAVEWIGRWSMVDIFVIGILVSLVQLGALARVSIEPAATFFAAVVVLTMLAAESFDARLIWDRAAARAAEPEAAPPPTGDPS